MDIQEKFKKFILDDIFWFNKSELNFGIYKIFRQKEELVKNTLEKIIDNIEKELTNINKDELTNLKEEILDYIPPKKAKELELESIEDLKEAIEAFANGDKEKLLSKLKEIETKDKYDSTKVYEYLYQFFNLYYEKGDFGYTPRSFKTYTVPYKYEEYLLEPQDRCSNEISHDIEYKGEETLFTWKTKDSYYIKSNKFLNSVSLNLEYKGNSYTIKTNVIQKDEDIKDDKKIKQYRLISITKHGNEVILNFNISDFATPKHTIYLLLLSVIEQNIESLNYDAIFKDKKLREFFEKLPFKDKTINPSLFDKTQVKVINSFKEFMQNEEFIKYLIELKKDKSGNIKSATAIFKEELKGEEDKTQLKSKVSKLMLSKKEYANKIYNNTKAKEFLKLDKKEKFSIEEAKDINKLYEKDSNLDFFYRLDRGINMFYAGVDSDYFIHKNLKRFLTVELDKFIKNYIFVDTDALLKMDESAKRVATFAKVFKEQAKEFIDLLSAIEEFQKYLWQKRKMVKSSHYIISSNKIEDITILEEVLKNGSQVREWEELGIINKNEKPNSLELQSYAYPIDTKHFDMEFKYKVLSLFSNIEEEIDGLLIKGENYQALKFLEPKYTDKKGDGKIKSIYIDPPYNTGSDGFIYKDNYKSASWLSMMQDRLEVARKLMREDGVIFTSIGEDEHSNLENVNYDVFGKENFIGNIIWEKVKIRKNSAKYFTEAHDYILVNAKKSLEHYSIGWKRELIERDTHNYKNPDNDPNGPWIKGSILANNPYEADYKITKPNGVVLSRPKDSYWRYSEESFLNFVKEDRVLWGKDDSYPYIKKYLKDAKDGLVPKTLFPFEEVDGNPHGALLIKDLFGYKNFTNPKPVKLIKYLVKLSDRSKNFIILDFFAGSGTTPHAVIDLNREDNGKRKFIAVEMNDYFETIILPRVKKVSFSKEWKDGKAQDKDGYSTIIKYIELEQYDDIIDNLEVVKDVDYSKIDFGYIYEPDKNKINFRMQNELRNPLSTNVKFDIFDSLVFHEGLELLTVKLEDEVLFATCKDRYENNCAIVLSNDEKKAKKRVEEVANSFDKIYTNTITHSDTKIETIVAETFKGK